MTHSQRADVTWRKSSWSGIADCVEVASYDRGILVRSSHDPDGSTLSCSRAAWRAFLAAAKAGQLDG